MNELPRVRELGVAIRGASAGRLLRKSQYVFEYAEHPAHPISLIMPVADRRFTDGELFAVMDMNLPEGFLLARIRERSPKSPPTKLQLLSLSGSNGIGWLEYATPGVASRRPRQVDRRRLLRDGVGKGGRVFDQLVDAYLSSGAGLSGVQPKILVPERATLPVSNLIVKAAGADYPGLAGNEFLCLEVARRAGLAAARHELSDDGQLLVIDRFDLGPRSERLGFEDIAALLDLRVGEALSDRKYRGSYEDVAAVVAEFSSAIDDDLRALFDAVSLSVIVRNGDAHLKNFAMLYDAGRRWLAPLFDVVTTTLYPYERAHGVRVTDRTLALKLRRGARDRLYPAPDALVAFGREVCRVADPRARLEPILDAMADTLRAAARDSRIARGLLAGLGAEWRASLAEWRRR